MPNPLEEVAEFKVGQLAALVKMAGGPDIVRQILNGKLKLIVAEQILLSRVAAGQVIGAKKFVAKDHLTSCNIGWTSDNFKKLFPNKEKQNVQLSTIAVHRLEKASLDAPILAELGERAEILLCHLFSLIEKQSKGEKGVLLTNGYANIAYVRDANGTLWAVYALWNSGFGCWGVETSSVENPNMWGDGRQVLSRDS